MFATGAGIAVALFFGGLLYRAGANFGEMVGAALLLGLVAVGVVVFAWRSP